MQTRHDVPELTTRELSCWLRDDWVVAVATTALDEEQLTVGETAILARLPTAGPRRRQWLTGRQALHAVLHRLGDDLDGSDLSMPHPRLALTHAGGSAVAVAARHPGQRGVGVDIEPIRRTPADIGRFFLRPTERRWLATCGPDSRDVETLRLWTVKEAIFKADLGNRGHLLYDYALDDAGCWQGQALKASEPTVHFDYRSVRTAAHLVSVARRKDPS